MLDKQPLKFENVYFVCAACAFSFVIGTLSSGLVHVAFCLSLLENLHLMFLLELIYVVFVSFTHLKRAHLFLFSFQVYYEFIIGNYRFWRL